MGLGCTARAAPPPPGAPPPPPRPSGKSTVGKLLAKALKYCFFDTDTLIEQAGCVCVGGGG